ncbi:hypothetical protein HZI73_00530 [Vallitalea pronyensis]|uniref:Uncharacterized protein n=1 Tax=Vallitalea pronyensis TaxID=1348613 RepID=A0A8J8MFZ0_9FIRM|nr:hypothetical protein [Vallitalea pronyensis]QUI20884.1 hypothetical protein HZI73_00530 [Vallitalea pronyensis]
MKQQKEWGIIIQLVIGVLTSLFILSTIIQSNIIAIIGVLVLGGGVTYLFERIATNEFDNSFLFIKTLKKYSGPRTKKLWQVVKSLTCLFILKLIGVDFLQFALDTFGHSLDINRLLLDSAITITSITGIIIFVSALIKLNKDEVHQLIKIDKSTRLSIAIPNRFLKEKIKEDEVSGYFVNPITRDDIMITYEEKAYLYDGINLTEYIEHLLEPKNYDEPITILKSVQISENNIYEMDFLNRKVKCKSLIRFLESDNGFISIKISTLKKNLEARNLEYREILNSIILTNK